MYRRILLTTGALFALLWWFTAMPVALWIWIAAWGLAYLNWALEDGFTGERT